MINNFLDADDTDNADLKGCAIKVDKKNPRYPCHPRLKNNIPNGANHLSPNTNHFYLIELAGMDACNQEIGSQQHQVQYGHRVIFIQRNHHHPFPFPRLIIMSYC